MREADELLRVLLEEFAPHLHAEQHRDLRAVVVVRAQHVDLPAARLEAAAVVFELKLDHPVEDALRDLRLLDHEDEELLHGNEVGDDLERPLVADDDRLVGVLRNRLADGGIVEPVRVGPMVRVDLLDRFDARKREVRRDGIGIELGDMDGLLIAPEGAADLPSLFVDPHGQLRPDIARAGSDDVDLIFLEQLVVLGEAVLLHQAAGDRADGLEGGGDAVRSLALHDSAHAFL